LAGAYAAGVTVDFVNELLQQYAKFSEVIKQVGSIKVLVLVLAGCSCCQARVATHGVFLHAAGPHHWRPIPHQRAANEQAECQHGQGHGPSPAPANGYEGFALA
jgi:hypothetical protein